MKTGTWLRGLAATACVAATLPAAAEQVTLRVHHFLPTGSTAHAKFITPWCDKINKESAGKLKCQIFPAMQLGGKPPQLIDQARDGIADIVWTLPGYSAGRFPVVEVFELPFMMTSAEATSRAVWDFVQAHDQAEFKDVRPLAFHVHGAGHFFTVKAPITSMADLSGLKLRAPTRLTNMMLGSLGATPVGMPVPQVPEALSKGVIDGAIIPYEVVPAIKVHELTKFASEGDPSYRGLYTTVFVFAMNPAKYDSLPDDLKKVIDANSGAETSAWIGKVWDEADGPARQRLVERGNPVNVIPAAELDKWKAASASVTEAWLKDVASKGVDGPALLDAARTLIDQHSK
ncbi:MAG: TRAP transporter substrate-binding protein [Rhodocyclaceae bacterium]|jgi:TRAP-type C4-dicarboxylate transport system substrate-binding protein|nr:TRAP transporter substrate-binding protein [Rhodocyclaceae bacterium]MCL4759991.1 TRAP transporter substrate-binding protein [Rhodocyclaceae bacterium]